MFRTDDDDTTNDDMRSLMTLIVGVILLIVCTVASCSEIQYAATGRIATAQVLRMVEVEHHSRRGGFYTTLEVSYRFEDGSLKRAEQDGVEPDWFADHPGGIAPDSTTVQVQYLPGAEGRSRLEGHTRWWLIIPLIVAVPFVLYTGMQFWRDYAAYQRRLKEER